MFKLFTYWRSSTAYRVRIALNLKGLAYEPAFVSIPKLEHRSAEYLAVNPQGLVPALVEDGRVVAQSLAILEFLEERSPLPPLLPSGLHERAYVRALSQVIACEIHPLNNVRVLRYLEQELAVDPDSRSAWYRRWIDEGMVAFEAMLQRHGLSGRCCFGDQPTMADVCLVPQVYNARRFACPLKNFPLAVGIAERCSQLEAFERAFPDTQPDAPHP
jgi:maleylacetoacetate isomerase/maleylpyruvate isomerase